VPFNIARTPEAAGGLVQDVTSGAATYGHRFLTTSGRAGRAIKVRSFDEYRARLLENFVVLERSERHNKIARELDAKAQRLQGRVSRAGSESGLLEEVPDLVEYPAVVAGTFAIEFLELPEEVLTTTLIHHQHYFPVEGEDGRLKNAFLAVINTEPDSERTIARNVERVVSARLRDARFFWEADRKVTLESRLDRVSTLLFHKNLGTYREKADRIERLARRIAAEHLGASDQVADYAAQAARLSKADLATDMVREFTELQGRMGGIYAREEGLPEEVWKAIYYHYLPIGVDADAPPTRAQLGKAAVTWAAVSLADKLDTIVGLFDQEKPTGSRDPYAPCRAAQGVVKVLVDITTLTGVRTKAVLGPMIAAAREVLAQPAGRDGGGDAVSGFLMDRLRHLMQVRGLDYDEIEVVTADAERIKHVSAADLVTWAAELKRVLGTPVFQAAADAHKRAKNIVGKELSEVALVESTPDRMSEPAELALRDALDRVTATVATALGSGKPKQAIDAIATIQPTISKFFDEVRVVVPDEGLKRSRLELLKRFSDCVSQFGDLSLLASRTSQSKTSEPKA
jgi:glycyl-tRNA synthetase beta chain